MNRKIATISAGAIAGALLLAGSVWACTPQTVITQLRPLSGPAGTTLSIAGSSPATVEIRWNSEDGPVLAQSPAGEFSVGAAIPADAKPGVYYLLSGGRALETFEVTSGRPLAAGRGAAGDLWGGFSQVGADSPAADSLSGPSSSALRLGGGALLVLGLGSGFVVFGLLHAGRATPKVSSRR